MKLNKEQREYIKELIKKSKENRSLFGGNDLNNKMTINYIKMLKEIERLHSIIKEVRDLVNKEEFTMKQKYEMREELLEILDKVEEK